LPRTNRAGFLNRRGGQNDAALKEQKHDGKNEFASGGSSPSSDFRVRDEGSILFLTPLTESARTWVNENMAVITASNRITQLS
jgi:hypothetical protein